MYHHALNINQEVLIMRMKLLSVGLLGLFLVGCASVPMESVEKDQQLKAFPEPPKGQAAVYIYRDSWMGKALKKDVTVNGKKLGATANKVFFYEPIMPGPTLVQTESEFSDNTLEFNAVEGMNYFVRQYIKMGAFVGGAGLELVDEVTGKKHVLGTKLAKSAE